METYDLGQLRAQLWLKSYQILFILLHVLIKSDPSSFTNERPNMETVFAKLFVSRRKND